MLHTKVVGRTNSGEDKGKELKPCLYLLFITVPKKCKISMQQQQCNLQSTVLRQNSLRGRLTV